MRLIVHDYPGHAFPIQLSRALAGRGHEVLHLHFADFQSPKGPLAPRPEDPPTLAIEALDIGEPFAKHSLPRRWRQEIAYGRLAAARIAAFRPDWTLSNGALDPQREIRRATQSAGGRYALWLQDFYGIAIDAILRRRFPGPGHLAGGWFRLLERRLLRASDAVVCITPDFLPTLESMGVERERCHVIPNWAPLPEIPSLPRDNAFARQHGLTGRTVFLYSGTMGFKHNPALLTALARAFPEALVVVASEGAGADWLRERKGAENLDNLRLLPFQPHERFPEMLASADVLVAMIEPEAGAYSVPSKVLSYLCAGRAILLSAPGDNLAARIVAKAHAGVILQPTTEETEIGRVAGKLLEADQRFGKAGRQYAVRAFDIEKITDTFEAVFNPQSLPLRTAAR